MPYLGNTPTEVPLTSADITDGIITSAKITDGTITNTDVASSIITGQTAETSIAGGDSILIYDDSATALRKMTRTNFVAGIGATAGQVIQVVTATDQTQRSTTSTSFVTASNTLSVSITPSSASNKIFIIVGASGQNDSTAYYTIYRGATNLGNGNNGMASIAGAFQSVSVNAGIGMSYLDSPSTTSAITYQVYWRVFGSTGYLNIENSKSSITCLEIKG